MSLIRYQSQGRKPLLRAALDALANRIAGKMEPVLIELAYLPPDLAEPLRAFQGSTKMLTVADAHRLFEAFGGLMRHRRELYRRQIELVQSASALEREVAQYQRLLSDNRR